MIQLTSQNGHTAYGLKEFIVSTEEEIKELPIEGILNGSTAFVIDTATAYMFDKDNEELWVKL